MHGHVPVLRTEVLSLLAPKPGDTVVDATLGLGGHAAAFLDAIGPVGRLIGVDADAENLALARKSLPAGVELHHGNFRQLPDLVKAPVDILFADLGLSSPHVDDASRGFTFRTSAFLDLRYDRGSGQTAAEFLLSSSEAEITRVLSEYGELPRSKTLARELHALFRSQVRHLQEWKTSDVVACVERVFGFQSKRVLPQVFQALRIAVNDEIGALRSLLTALPALLRPGGRSGIISYHSLEDREVKRALRSLCTVEKDPRTGQDLHAPQWSLLTRKGVTPSAEEIAANPRARSAVFRAIARIPR